MNTTFPLPAQPIFERFFWKEYRMLRGFWLAVGVLAMIVQWVLPHFQYDARIVPDQLFAIAWGAAALYAVGAAITLFSAEREERTHDFLRLLPDRWLPMFVGKVLLAMLSAFALAMVLSITGQYFSYGVWPTEAVVRETLALLGVAIVETTVWGLLFSLWMKQPLLAAIVSMAAASLGAQFAVIATSPNDATAYSQAVPARLLVCLGVFLIDIRLASRWLQPALGVSPRFLKRRNAAYPLVAKEVAVASSAKTHDHDHRRRRMLARLLWQTWRESWTTMLMAVPIALCLMAAIYATTWISKTNDIAAFLCPLLLPALFGALVFRADQRRGHRQFLVAHAGRPRYVWFARQIVWLTTLIALGCVLYFMAVLLAAIGLQEHLQDYLRNQFFADGYHQTVWSIATQSRDALLTLWSLTSVGWCAMLAAYGLGQLCSMLLSREVLAGFLALLLAAVLTAWSIVVGLWELNPGWYVLPIGVVAMAATWLRAPDWIVGRNSPRAWMAPALAIVLPLGLVFSRLPQARLDQIALAPSSRHYNYLQEPLEDSLRELNSTQAAARQTATAYEQLYASLVTLEEAAKGVRVDGMTSDELMESFYDEPDFDERAEENVGRVHIGRRGGQLLAQRGWRPAGNSRPPRGGVQIVTRGGYGGEMGGYGGGIAGGYGGEMGGYGGGFGYGSFTPEQEELLNRFEKAEQLAFIIANQEPIAELEVLSRQSACQFPAEVAFVGNRGWDRMRQLKQLLFDDALRLEADGQLSETFARFLTIARIDGQLLSNQPSNIANVFLKQLTSEPNSLDEAIFAWAKNPNQTSKSLKTAIRDLQEVYANYPKLREAVLADHLAIRDVLLEKEPARFFADKHKTWIAYLPYMANKLSWERKRSLRALDILTGLRLNYMDGAAYLLAGGEVQQSAYRERFSLSQILHSPSWQSDVIVNESIYEGDWDAYYASKKFHYLCRTSYLLMDESQRRVDAQRFLVASIDAEIAHRGLLMQLALIAYRLDQDEYPESLAELSPDYLADVPLDPYSQEPFEYRAAGLDLPLRYEYPLRYNGSVFAANTPLLWSVGSFNYVLKQHIVNEENYGESPNEIIDSELTYYLQPTSHCWRGSQDLVFPLPTNQTPVHEPSEKSPEPPRTPAPTSK